jgi:hypothetical protein
VLRRVQQPDGVWTWWGWAPWPPWALMIRCLPWLMLLALVLVLMAVVLLLPLPLILLLPLPVVLLLPLLLLPLVALPRPAVLLAVLPQAPPQVQQWEQPRGRPHLAPGVDCCCCRCWHALAAVAPAAPVWPPLLRQVASEVPPLPVLPLPAPPLPLAPLPPAALHQSPSAAAGSVARTRQSSWAWRLPHCLGRSAARWAAGALSTTESCRLAERGPGGLGAVAVGEHAR